MVQEIAAGLYTIEIPLPVSQLRSINSYVITAPTRNMIIDTGMYHDECMAAMQAGLHELDVDLSKTDFFITHCHGDHFGLVPRLINNGAAIYINTREADVLQRIKSGAIISEIADFIHASGFPESEVDHIFPDRGSAFKRVDSLPFRFVDDGDCVEAGDYQLQCVRTPGHTKGHICLYEPTKKFLIAGDHLLGDITPGIQGRCNTEDPLKEYLQSLDKIDALDIEMVLPGHRGLFKNCHERITELQEHHRQRAQEVIAVVREGELDTYQVASRMTWDVDCDSWDVFPLMQQFFATGEACAHLRYLEEQGIIQSKVQQGRVVYSLRDA